MPKFIHSYWTDRQRYTEDMAMIGPLVQVHKDEREELLALLLLNPRPWNENLRDRLTYSLRYTDEVIQSTHEAPEPHNRKAV